MTETRYACPVCGHNKLEHIDVTHSTKRLPRSKWRSKNRPLLTDFLDEFANPNYTWQNLYHYRCLTCDYILAFAYQKHDK